MPTKPKAYLNYLFFDEAMKVVAEESGALQVTQANAWSDLTKPIFPINRNGFVYVYSCNNSEAIVRTDNLLVVHYTGRLLEEFHYYPFGLCFEVSKSPALEKSSEQRYNSQFIQQDEFVDANGQTYGLEDYDFAFRNYDPQIGRWMQPDPLMQHASPYLAMSNNPVLFTDPSGLYDLNEVVITADRPYWMSYEGYFDSPGQNPFDRSNLMADMVYENGAKYRKADQVTDVFGKVQNHGTAYGRGNYWANELASREIQKNNGINSKLIVSIGGVWSNSKLSLDIGGGIFGALETTVRPGDLWLGKNGKYYNNSWGGNQYTGSRSGAFKAASNYKWAGRAVLGASVIIGGTETINGFQKDGGRFGYNAQSAAFGTAGSIVGGWAGAEAGAWSFGIAGGLIGGPPGAVIGAVIGGFVGGLGGGYLGGNVGGGAVNYYHSR